MIGQVRYDQDADAAFVRLAEGDIVTSSEIAPGLVVDWGAADELLGVEVLHVAKRLNGAEPSSFVAGLAEGLLATKAFWENPCVEVDPTTIEA